MNADDQMFWDRLQDMPAWEAEQECVLRREHCALELAMLKAEQEATPLPKEKKRVGVGIADVNGQLTLLNERIKYLRKLQDRICWKEAVKTVLGSDACDACIVWMEQQFGDVYAQRREWAAK